MSLQEDLQFAHQQTGSVGSAVVGVTATALVGPSPKRRSITFFGANAGRVTLGNDAGLSLDNGPTFVQSSGPIEIRRETHGDLVSKPWFGIAAVAASAVGWIECLDGT